MQTLNGIIHPEVAQRFDRWCSRQNAPYAIKEAAILFETGGQEICSRTLLVCSPKHLRIARIKKRDGVSEKQIEARMQNQWSDEDKMKLAHFVVTNDVENALIPQVISIDVQMKKLIDQHAQYRTHGHLQRNAGSILFNPFGCADHAVTFPATSYQLIKRVVFLNLQ